MLSKTNYSYIFIIQVEETLSIWLVVVTGMVIVTHQHAIQGMHVTHMPVTQDIHVTLMHITVGSNRQPFLFNHSPWFFSPSCGAACCRAWDPHCHHWLHPCSPKAEKRFAQNMSSYLKSLAESYEHQANLIKPPRSASIQEELKEMNC